MPRPREFDRAQALERAMHLFWEQGYERTTIRDLTEAMGISAPSLYNAFGDKAALFAEAVAEYERSSQVIAPRAADEPISREVLARILEVAVLQYSSVEHPRGCLVISDPVLSEQRERGRVAIHTRLRLARDRGELAADSDLTALTNYIDLVLRGLSSLARDGVDADELRAAAEVALRAWPAR